MSFGPISDILWRERHLLDRLEARLDEAGVSDGRGHAERSARQEAELIVLELQRAELDRAVAAHGVACQLGLSTPPTLGQLAGALPSPWGLIFARHRSALLDRIDRAPGSLVPQSLREALG